MAGTLGATAGLHGVEECALCRELEHVHGGALGPMVGPIKLGLHACYVHRLCALWAPEVYQSDQGTLKHVGEAVRRGRTILCSHCGKRGATVGCRVEKCTCSYHLWCAKEAKCLFNVKNFVLACQGHAKLFLHEQPNHPNHHPNHQPPHPAGARWTGVTVPRPPRPPRPPGAPHPRPGGSAAGSPARGAAGSPARGPELEYGGPPAKRARFGPAAISAHVEAARLALRLLKQQGLQDVPMGPQTAGFLQDPGAGGVGGGGGGGVGHDVDEAEWRWKEARRVAKDTARLAPVILAGTGGRAQAEALAASSGGAGGPARVWVGDEVSGFESLGGLSHVVASLQEVALLPLLHPHLLHRMGVQAPRGILLHGAPGSGKTSAVRALAAECARASPRPVCLYVRKGADCLGKYVGDAERTLRLLFTEASHRAPSIIFLDELDALAPARSTRESTSDQVHASVVSTLLSLMDGMSDRGQVLVIAATNRPDTLDPALRRPGRFDREICFDLPDLNARADILTRLTRLWRQPPPQPLVQRLAQSTPGYAGADLQALCCGAVLAAARRAAPFDLLAPTPVAADPMQPLADPQLEAVPAAAGAPQMPAETVAPVDDANSDGVLADEDTCIGGMGLGGGGGGGGGPTSDDGGRGQAAGSDGMGSDDDDAGGGDVDMPFLLVPALLPQGEVPSAGNAAHEPSSTGNVALQPSSTGNIAHEPVSTGNVVGGLPPEASSAGNTPHPRKRKANFMSTFTHALSEWGRGGVTASASKALASSGKAMASSGNPLHTSQPIMGLGASSSLAPPDQATEPVPALPLSKGVLPSLEAVCAVPQSPQADGAPEEEPEAAAGHISAAAAPAKPDAAGVVPAGLKAAMAAAAAGEAQLVPAGAGTGVVQGASSSDWVEGVRVADEDWWAALAAAAPPASAREPAALLSPEGRTVPHALAPLLLPTLAQALRHIAHTHMGHVLAPALATLLGPPAIQPPNHQPPTQPPPASIDGGPPYTQLEALLQELDVIEPPTDQPQCPTHVTHVLQPPAACTSALPAICTTAEGRSGSNSDMVTQHAAPTSAHHNTQHVMQPAQQHDPSAPTQHVTQPSLPTQALATQHRTPHDSHPTTMQQHALQGMLEPSIPTAMQHHGAAMRPGAGRGELGHQALPPVWLLLSGGEPDDLGRVAGAVVAAVQGAQVVHCGLPRLLLLGGGDLLAGLSTALSQARQTGPGAGGGGAHRPLVLMLPGLEAWAIEGVTHLKGSTPDSPGGPARAARGGGTKGEGGGGTELTCDVTPMWSLLQQAMTQVTTGRQVLVLATTTLPHHLLPAPLLASFHTHPPDGTPDAPGLNQTPATTTSIPSGTTGQVPGVVSWVAAAPAQQTEARARVVAQAARTQLLPALAQTLREGARAVMATTTGDSSVVYQAENGAGPSWAGGSAWQDGAEPGLRGARYMTTAAAAVAAQCVATSHLATSGRAGQAGPLAPPDAAQQAFTQSTARWLLSHPYVTALLRHLAASPGHQRGAGSVQALFNLLQSTAAGVQIRWSEFERRLEGSLAAVRAVAALASTAASSQGHGQQPAVGPASSRAPPRPGVVASATAAVQDLAEVAAQAAHQQAWWTSPSQRQPSPAQSARATAGPPHPPNGASTGFPPLFTHAAAGTSMGQGVGDLGPEPGEEATALEAAVAGCVGAALPRLVALLQCQLQSQNASDLGSTAMSRAAGRACQEVLAMWSSHARHNGAGEAGDGVGKDRQGSSKAGVEQTGVTAGDGVQRVVQAVCCSLAGLQEEPLC